MIKDLKLNDVTSDDFLLSQCECITSGSGRQYGRVVLEDASGKMDGVLWDNVHLLNAFKSGDIVHAQIAINQYKGVLQAKIISMSHAETDSGILKKVIPTSPYDIDAMLLECIEFVKSINDEWLSKLVNYFYSDSAFLKKMRNHPAAANVHHAYSGGLLQHTLNVTRLVSGVAQVYPYLNRELAITVALLHDIGKMQELNSLPAHTYTVNGNLIGHVVEGQNMVRDACNSISGFPADKRDLVCHCILSHHGQMEYGSPKIPAVLEAMVVNMCDLIDSRTEQYYQHCELNRTQLEADMFTPFNNYLGTRITDQALF